MNENETEIIVRFPTKELKELFLVSMIDGSGSDYYGFNNYQVGDYSKKYDEHGRLICYCDWIGEEE